MLVRVVMKCNESQDSSIGIATGYGLVSIPCGGWELLDAMSRPALGPTQPAVQWIPGALSLG